LAAWRSRLLCLLPSAFTRWWARWVVFVTLYWDAGTESRKHCCS
jgi:hypothetical protein